MLTLFSAALFLQVEVNIGRDSRADSVRSERDRARRDSLAMRMDSIIAERDRREPRRIPVTEEHLATAFRHPAARDLLARARERRLAHDAGLESYDAKSYQRMSVGMSLRRGGRGRLLFRHEDAARVRWSRDGGVRIDVTGSRTAVPMAPDARAEIRGPDLYPVPYFPGRESLSLFGRIARREVDERQLVHPLAVGAEAYYTYAVGDSAAMTLPDGARISIIELRIEARRPLWNLVVGSFWFDRATAQLVRVAYRMAVPMDIVMVAERENDDDDIPRWLRPMIATLGVVTIEYGLHRGDGGGFFWLPRAQYADGDVQVGFARMPIKLEQSFTYASVNGASTIPPPPEAAARDVALVADTTLADSLRRAARVRGREGYDTGDERVYVNPSYRRGVPTVVSVPNDTAALGRSSDLPPSIYDETDELFSRAEAEELARSLGFGLQAAWDPQRPTIHYGLEQGLLRYNRVEGLSPGIAVQQTYGRGYSARAMARIGIADWEPNAELSLRRSDGRRDIALTGYRRLAVANDWGEPLGVGSSLSALLFGRDEGFYYRATGAELSGTLDRSEAVSWRVFAERQQNARKQTDFSIPNLINDVEFRDNIRANRADLAGLEARARDARGVDPRGWRLFSDARIEGAVGDFDFARGAADVTVTRGLGRRLGAAVTLGAGTTAGDVPAQRLWYLGGVHTVRGQPASATAANAVGNAFWLGRGELGFGLVAARPVAFFDLGWAGDRRDFADRSLRPISGAGLGASFLDGLVRLDIAKGLRPSRGWRGDLYLEARF